VLDITDDVSRIDNIASDDALVSALTSAYSHATTHIAEFAKLQYQLVAIAYGLAGAAIAFFGSQLTPQLGSVLTGAQLQSTFLLFLPPIFYAISFVQIYLHTQIKRYGRYVSYDLRPKMEAIIEARLRIEQSFSQGLKFWNWETVYEEDIKQSLLSKIHSWIVRALSLLIMILPVVPAVASIGLYEFFHQGGTFTELETAVRWLNIMVGGLTLVLIGVIGWINLFVLEKQARDVGGDNKSFLLKALKNSPKQPSFVSEEDPVVKALIDVEINPTIIALISQLTESPKNKEKLLKHLVKVLKPSSENDS
jgi:hypothetical protein